MKCAYSTAISGVTTDPAESAMRGGADWAHAQHAEIFLLTSNALFPLNFFSLPQMLVIRSVAVRG